MHIPQRSATGMTRNKSNKASKKKEVNKENTGYRVAQEIRADYDDQGVWFYQAFKDSIADWAIEHQTLGGAPEFRPLRMTWIKPSFAWVLYRSGYATKHSQE